VPEGRVRGNCTKPRQDLPTREPKQTLNIGPLVVFWVAFAVAPTALADSPPAPDYAKQIAPILKKYCAGCHNDEDREGKI